MKTSIKSSKERTKYPTGGEIGIVSEKQYESKPGKQNEKDLQ